MKATILLAFSFFIFQSIFAQTTDEQFQELKENAETFKEYKVIKIETLNSFWKSISDSLNAKNATINQLSKKITLQQNEVDGIQNSMLQMKQQLSDLEHDATHINIIGFSLDKVGFQVFNFLFIAGLLAIIGLSAFTLKDRQKVANEKIRAYNGLESEFEEYKKDALEKQMKLRRELQTERNKLEQIQNL